MSVILSTLPPTRINSFLAALAKTNRDSLLFPHALHTRPAFLASVKRVFAGLHARAFCHATEDLERVRLAMANVLGDVETRISRTAGIHGNPITVLKTVINDHESIMNFVKQLTEEDLEELLRSLDSRIDDDCNLFIRIDKQEAYQGRVRLARGDDMISIRVRVIAFPARCSVASDVVRELLSSSLAKKAQ